MMTHPTNRPKPCRAVSHYYADYYDGALPLRERAHVETHLRACASCFEDYRSYTGVCDLLHGLPKMEAPFGFADRVRFALRQEDAARAERGASLLGMLRFPAWRALAPAAGVAATLVAALVVVQMQRDIAPPADASATAAGASPVTAPTAPGPALAETLAPAAAQAPVPVAEKVAEIEALVEDINALAAQTEDPIFLGADNEYELVFNPAAVYGRAPVDAQQASHPRP